MGRDNIKVKERRKLEEGGGGDKVQNRNPARLFPLVNFPHSTKREEKKRERKRKEKRKEHREGPIPRQQLGEKGRRNGLGPR